MSTRSVTIHNLSPADMALFQQVVKDSQLSAPLAARDVFRAGLDSLSAPKPIPPSVEELFAAPKPKPRRKKKATKRAD